jgi:CheY-like chemotaxis protein
MHDAFFVDASDDTGVICDLSGFTVLLVEDLEINREIVSAVLECTRVNIEAAENGARAVEMFAASPDKYDIILMDLQMPVMDGLEATRRIRAMDLDKAREIAILAMTANVFREDVDKCQEAGMDDHIAKPIDTVLLIEKLNSYLLAGGLPPR